MTSQTQGATRAESSRHHLTHDWFRQEHAHLPGGLSYRFATLSRAAYGIDSITRVLSGTLVAEGMDDENAGATICDSVRGGLYAALDELSAVMRHEIECLSKDVTGLLAVKEGQQ